MLTLFICADASVRGEAYFDKRSGRTQRRMIGPATVGCVGWLGHHETPTLETEVCLEGTYGPQAAEYEALNVGMGTALAFVAGQPGAVTHVLIQSDNEVVVSTLNHTRNAILLKPYRETTRTIQGWLEDYGVEVNYAHVPRRDPRHKLAHQLADRARLSR